TETGTVTVTLKQADPWAVLTVEDSGIGIPEKDIPQLFKEFYRASNARQSGIKGTGVGLVIVKELVERFSGEIELKSMFNEGSCFTIRLPIYSPDF
ncbi:MAG: ATP-binding protein, partial [bacterium]|nr:ATP-binding protein [bacterium]